MHEYWATHIFFGQQKRASQDLTVHKSSTIEEICGTALMAKSAQKLKSTRLIWVVILLRIYKCWSHWDHFSLRFPTLFCGKYKNEK